MKVHHIYPSEESEKAISNYTKQLIKAQKKQRIEINQIEYTAGDHTTLRLDDIKRGDVIHIQHEYNLLGMFGIPFFVLYKNLRERMKSKVITTMHSVLSQKEKFNENFIKTFLRKTLYRFQNRRIRNNSDLVIVHAEFFKKILVNEYNFQEEKVIVLRQGIQEEIKLIPKEQAKKELMIRGNVYLIIGSLIPDHGADIIINQAKQIDGTILVVANNKAVNDRNDSRIKDWLEHLKNIVKEKNISNVRFDIGNLPYELWWKYFAAADVVLLPYRGGIGSGIFADCIAARKPMVGSNIKYFNEFAKDWDFIEITNTEKDYPRAIETLYEKDIVQIESQFDEYIEEYGLTNLSKKYKEIYNGK